MRSNLYSAGILLFALAFIPIASSAQESADVARKALVKTQPSYPVLARRMNIHGSVKLEAVVAPDGTVKSVAVKGGHPVLAESAVMAVQRWKFEPSSHETRQQIEINFAEQ
jgi:TonB family protein